MKAQSIVSPEDQSATFVELFFDLVFVFSVTQIVGLLHEGITWITIGQAILVFWLVWWAWTQFTWALNAADTTHSLVELSTLVATGVAFFMAVALPDAFHGGGLWFALPYVLVRIIGLGLYIWVASADPSQRAAVQRFGLVSIGGLAAVLIGGFIGGSIQYWMWGVAILLDVLAAVVGGEAEGWNLHHEHFGERHGLFVIIALGESLIIAASGMTHAAWTSNLVIISILAVTITCALWWSYFPCTKHQIDHVLEALHGAEQSRLARDVYSLFHFPMLCGIIAYAVAIEEIVAHPSEPLEFEGRAALALGLILFVGGMVVAFWRAAGRLLLSRLIFTIVTAVLIVAMSGIAPLLSLTIALIGLLIIIAMEEWSRTIPISAPHHAQLPSDVKEA
ncbi:MAG: low temperature requirement protein A [Anaerolineae bacterium]|nr:low temperature requirement protein A [Anaerolineae bacterium]